VKANLAGSANALDQTTGCNGTAYSYDANGNPISDGNAAYTYDNEGDGHILTASLNGTVATYQYDPFGRRFSKTVNGTTVYSLFGEAGLA